MFGTKISRESNRYRLFINLGNRGLRYSCITAAVPCRKIENPEPHKIR